MANTQFKKGHIMTKEMREKISQKLRGVKKSPQTVAKMSAAQKGHPYTEEHRKNQSLAMSGRKASPETRLKMSLAQRGEKGNKWKGGITPLYLQIRHHMKSRQLSSDCFTRDEFTCQNCGDVGGKLNCHHIKYFSDIVEDNEITTLEQAVDCEELWNLNNAITLCKDCHILRHKQDG